MYMQRAMRELFSTVSGIPFPGLLQRDFQRIYSHNLSPYPMDTKDREYRYEQSGDTYRLQSWHHGVGRMQHGHLHERPDWLVRILDVAAAAGAVNRAVNPPPEIILWFRTDTEDNLTEYVNI